MFDLFNETNVGSVASGSWPEIGGSPIIANWVEATLLGELTKSRILRQREETELHPSIQDVTVLPWT